MSKSSQISGFYKLSIDERLKIVTEFSGLSEEEVNLLRAESSLKLEIADRMIENVIGVYPLPLGVATNFLINGKDYLIPMVIEEPSVVAAASHGAKMARVKGGFKALSTEPIMIGQVQVVKVPDPYGARMRLLEAKEEILAKANEQDPTLVKLGGGAKDLDVKVIDSIRGPMVILELHVDCKDAMGANIVNGMAEAVAPLVEKIAGGKVLLRILSNLAVKRLARAKAVVAKEAVGGEEVVDAILEAYAFALADPFRAATHNKGIMNGIVAVATATGNDTRAIEAGAHAYAARFGRYMPLSTWEKNADGDLVGTLEMPLAVGIVGGATRTHPIAKIALKILGVKTARELSEVMCSVGLAQNLAALKALATEGIQRGHMELHARNLAIAAGAVGDLVDKVAEQMVRERRISFDRAKQILQELTQKK
ncbi:MAG: hydroxymethylglutaryl-CoA reductase, degradative [Candidatus Methanomethylicota archaeon]|uniref:3-hydroxy-3-methylglutaryl coenzyme A reductase n=1 Tax=Thermoproteota archaeon TaxID=2056631 RepID=A0A497ELA0_9CREN|nr:MAG: hydroxymethylglutaryl-CoA reductase, degradative [Candidatus Verstraetearchaeota archaeon]